MSNLKNFSTRVKVLNLYKKALKLSKGWMAMRSEDTTRERKYIENETKQLFKNNKNLKDEEEVKSHIKEAEARIELAIHYRIPYPKPTHFPQTFVNKNSIKNMKKEEEIKKIFKPIYTKSYFK